MSEPSEQGLQKVIECDVCLNHFDLGTRKPKTLSCGHTFCLFCLENLQNGGTLSCPTCRINTPVPHGDAGDLPTNFSSLSLLPNYKAAKFQSVCNEIGETKDGFNFPRYIAVCPTSGNIIVSDTRNHRIVIFDSKFQNSSVFGSDGEKDGEYIYTYGVAINQQNQIFVSDFGNHRIQVTDIHGNFIRKFGSCGSYDGQFSHPTGLCLDGNNQLYVCDSRNYRIHVRREDGSSVMCWGSKGYNAGQFQAFPRSIAISPSGKAVVTDNYSNLYIFTTDGTHIKTIHKDTPPQNIQASGVAIDQYNNIIITDRRGYIVVMSEDGEVMCTIGRQGDGGGEFKIPLGVIVTKCDDILVCDKGNHQIQQFHVPKMVK